MIKDVIVVNTRDISSREFLTSIPVEGWSPETLILDYYKNDEHTIRALDDLRSIGINFSSFPSAVLRTSPSPVTGKSELAVVNGFKTWEELQNSRWTAFVTFLIEDVHPESDRVRIFQDSLALNLFVPSSVMPAFLACRTIVQLQGVYSKLLKEGCLKSVQRNAIENLAEDAGVTIKLRTKELVLVEGN